MKTTDHTDHYRALRSAKTVVIKLGSAVLSTPEMEMDMPVFEAICSDIAALMKSGKQVILVTSAAVAAGRGVLGIKDKKPVMAVKQALAAVGQSRLMQIYSDIFAKHGIPVGQILLAVDDMEDRRRYVNFRYSLEALWEHGALPIINENDTVTVDELKFGDNDGLAAIVAVSMQADALILLSDVDGLYDSNPKVNPDAKLLKVVEKISSEMLAGTKGDGPKTTIQVGTGGMTTKVLAARLATQNGLCCAIAQGKKPGIIAEVTGGEFHGTLFPAQDCELSRRERWILAAKTGGRYIVVDDGAREALTKKKKSLLPAGITEIGGTFHETDMVEIRDSAGEAIARGVVNYSSENLRRIIGRKTAEIEKILGFRPYNEAIHRDNLAIIP